LTRGRGEGRDFSAPLRLATDPPVTNLPWWGAGFTATFIMGELCFMVPDIGIWIKHETRE